MPLCICPYISFPLPPYFCKPTPTISFRCSNHLNLSCLTTSATLWIPRRLYIAQTLTVLSVPQGHSINPSHHHMLCPFLDCADFRPSIPMFQSYMSAHSRHELCKSILDMICMEAEFNCRWRGCQIQRLFLNPSWLVRNEIRLPKPHSNIHMDRRLPDGD